MGFKATIDMVLEPHELRNKMGRLCVNGEARSDLTKAKLTSRIDAEAGPAGGAAVVTIFGSRAAVSSYLTKNQYDATPVTRR